MVERRPVDSSIKMTNSAVTPPIAPPNNSVRRRCWTRFRVAMSNSCNTSFLRLHRADRCDPRGEKSRIESGNRTDQQDDDEGGDQVAGGEPGVEPRAGEEEIEPIVGRSDPDAP